MADDYEGLGSYEIFPVLPNWATRPTSSYNFVRFLLQYQGGTQQIFAMTEDAPIKVEAGFTIWDRDEEYDLLDFFDTIKGRVGAFWLKHPKEAFTLSSNISSGAVAFPCYPNETTKQYQGYERVYMLLSSGDIITRHIKTVTTVSGETNLNFDEPLDRDILIEECQQTGRLLLVRCDEDKLALSCVTDMAFDINMAFQELPVECAAI